MSYGEGDLVLAAAMGLFFFFFAKRLPRNFGDDWPVRLTEAKGDVFAEKGGLTGTPGIDNAPWIDF
jgi:hypothetical protein